MSPRPLLSFLLEWEDVGVGGALGGAQACCDGAAGAAVDVAVVVVAVSERARQCPLCNGNRKLEVSLPSVPDCQSAAFLLTSGSCSPF